MLVHFADSCVLFIIFWQYTYVYSCKYVCIVHPHFRMWGQFTIIMHHNTYIGKYCSPLCVFLEVHKSWSFSLCVCLFASTAPCLSLHICKLTISLATSNFWNHVIEPVSTALIYVLKIVDQIVFLAVIPWCHPIQYDCYLSINCICTHVHSQINKETIERERGHMTYVYTYVAAATIVHFISHIYKNIRIYIHIYMYVCVYIYIYHILGRGWGIFWHTHTQQLIFKKIMVCWPHQTSNSAEVVALLETWTPLPLPTHLLAVPQLYCFVHGKYITYIFCVLHVQR